MLCSLLLLLLLRSTGLLQVVHSEWKVACFQSENGRDSVEELDLSDPFELALADLGELGQGLDQLLVEAKEEQVICELHHIEALIKFFSVVPEHVLDADKDLGCSIRDILLARLLFRLGSLYFLANQVKYHGEEPRELVFRNKETHLSQNDKALPSVLLVLSLFRPTTGAPPTASGGTSIDKLESSEHGLFQVIL